MADRSKRYKKIDFLGEGQVRPSLLFKTGKRQEYIALFSMLISTYSLPQFIKQKTNKLAK